jgi:type III restriction enzyme
VYGEYLKPISIVVTEKIVSCIKAWKELVTFIAGQEGITEEAAKRRVIWVTSSVPGEKTAEGKAVRDFLGCESAEKQRKANLLLLKSVDDSTNPVEWIVSVSMLTEGWDVKNVFQVVPHENRAFNSKLLISQVLGRGLRIPVCLKNSGKTPSLTVNNHERWTTQIENLYKDVLEVENRLSWGYDPRRSTYDFMLHNLAYESKMTTTQKNSTPPSDPKSFGLQPQNRSVVTTDTFSETGEHKFTIMTTGNCEMDAATTMLHGYLKMKDAAIGQRWPKSRIRQAIETELKTKGYDATFLSKENYEKAQQAFGTLMRKTDETYPRFSLKSTDAQDRRLADLPRSSFHEGSLKGEGLLYYDSESAAWFAGEQKALFDELTEKSANYDRVAEANARFGIDMSDQIHLKERIKKIDGTVFKSPLSVFYVSYKPEREFARLLLAHSDLYDSFIKNPDKGFYSFPYSYKPETKARTHVKQENFNPDFFLKKDGNVIVVEIKKEGDDSSRNKAKLRDGVRHFSDLNVALEKQGIPERYAFKFLSPPDYEAFFQALRDGHYQQWQSGLMNVLK